MSQYKTVEKYLRKYKWLKLFVEENKKLLEEIKEDYQGVKSVTYDLLPCYTSDFFSVVESETLSRAETIKRLENKVKETEDLIKRIDVCLNELNQTECQILELYYIDNLPWFKIAYHAGLSERQCKRLRNQAVQNIVTTFTANV